MLLGTYLIVAALLMLFFWQIEEEPSHRAVLLALAWPLVFVIMSVGFVYGIIFGSD